MDEKSSNLIKCLGEAYENQAVKNDAELSNLLATSARPLMGNDDDKVYFEVISKLGKEVSKYYKAHHETIPKEFLAIYQQIEKDIPAHSIEAKKVHKFAASFGALSIG